MWCGLFLCVVAIAAAGASCGMLLAGIRLQLSLETTEAFTQTECSSNVSHVTHSKCKATAMTVDVRTGRRVRLQIPPYPGAECFDLSYENKQVLLWIATISAGSPTAVFGCFVETGNKSVSIGVLRRASDGFQVPFFVFGAFFLVAFLACVILPVIFVCVDWISAKCVYKNVDDDSKKSEPIIPLASVSGGDKSVASDVTSDDKSVTDASASKIKETIITFATIATKSAAGKTEETIITFTTKSVAGGGKSKAGCDYFV